MVGDSQFARWLVQTAGSGFLKMAFSITGGSAVHAVELCERLYLRLPESSNLIDRGVSSGISRRKIYRLAEKVFQGDVPKLVPKERSSRFTEGKMKASLIYHEQSFQVNSGTASYVISVPFLYERHTGLLFAMKLADVRPSSRINFIRKVVTALQSGRISPWQKQIQIQTLSLPNWVLNQHRSTEQEATLLTRRSKDIYRPTELIRRKLVADKLPLAKRFRVVEWSGYTSQNAISLNMPETGLMRSLAGWIKVVNQCEIQNIAEQSNRDLRHQVIVKHLFPHIEKMVYDFDGVGERASTWGFVD